MMLNNQQLGLIEDDDHDHQGMMMMSMCSSQTQTPFSSNPINLTTNTNNNIFASHHHHHHHLIALDHHATSPNPKQHLLPPSTIPHQLLSTQKSAPNPWAWGEEEECQGIHIGGEEQPLGVSTMKMKMKKIKLGRRKVREPRFCFKTLSDVDILDDGYKWRKYGQKVVKNTLHPRSYYRCTEDKCRVKKRVERLAEDPRMVITTYEGRHPHSPSQHDMDEHSQTPHPLLNNFFLW